MKYKILLPLIFLWLNVQAQNYKVDLVTNNKSPYSIVISESAAHWDSLAASELQKYIHEISGVKLTIINDTSPEKPDEIIIGRNKHTAGFNLPSIKKNDGFVVQNIGSKIFFEGRGKGTLYAVYTFLEKYLNCRMYSSTVKYVPKRNNISLSGIKIIENPAFEYRDVHYFESTNTDYANWHKLVTSSDKKEWGMFVHTFQELLPPEKYFKKHPEYYALRNGIRVPEQPCLSNPNVLRIVTKELKKRMKENPGAKIWSVSQNDNYSYCQCPDCRRIDSIEGSPSGSIINFVNKIAREFPDKIISTLAYQYSRKPPAHIKPAKNVNIMLCTIECYRSKPIASDASGSGFLKDLKAWSKITKNIFLWDYVVQFTNLISPFPNFQVLQPNIKLFAKYGARMMFQQGSGNSRASEFEELRSYLIAKLLWNPDINLDSVMNDFLNGYYGNAGKYIREYIDLMRNELLKSDFNLNLYGSPVDGMKNYLSPDLMERYNHLFDEAEASEKSNPEILNRVKIAKLPLIYAMLEQAKVIGTGKRGLVIRNTEAGYNTNPKIISLLNELYSYTKNIPDVYLNEKGLTPETYIARYKSMLSKTMKNPLGLFKPVEFLTKPNWKYPANGTRSLTDGMCGDVDYHFNWVGYEGNNMKVIVDLQKETKVKKVSADFLQNSFSWVFLPTEFKVGLSTDGKNFTTVGIVKNTVPVTKQETLSPENAFIKNFSCEFPPVKTRYIKVTALNRGICPRWHPGYPFKAWIFTDEIVVE